MPSRKYGSGNTNKPKVSVTFDAAVLDKARDRARFLGLALSHYVQRSVCQEMGIREDRLETLSPGQQESLHRDQAHQYMRAKSASVGFRQTIARALEHAGIRFRREQPAGEYIVDFTVGDVAIVAQYNLRESYGLALGECLLLHDLAVFGSVLFCVPAAHLDAVETGLFRDYGFTVTTPPRLARDLGHPQQGSLPLEG